MKHYLLWAAIAIFVHWPVVFAQNAEFPQVSSPIVLAPNLISIEVLDGEIHRPGPEPYIAEEGDEITPDGEAIPVITKDGIARENFAWKLIRKGQEIGKIFHPQPHYKPMLWKEVTQRSPIDLNAWSKPESFGVSTGSKEPGITPVAIHRKTRPANDNVITGEKVLEHRFYLLLPEALLEGNEYKIKLPQGEKVFRYDPARSEHEAIHINQIGYRPDDPFKRAFLSLWTGDGGGWKFEAQEFEIITASDGEVVYRGKIEEGFPADRAEVFREPRNYVGADVQYLDFHDFQKTGDFRIRIPGVGISKPFTVSETSWLTAFQKSMHGLLVQRSGIELGPPFTKYERPRPMHPQDGVKIFRIPHTMLEGEVDAIREGIEKNMQSGAPVIDWPAHSDAWGGYMDAGDWDRRSQHLTVSRHLIELFQTNPNFFEKVSLALPEEEAHDKLPDVLNEALWNIAFYRRLQEADGGVGGGVESTQHPRPGERSWEETLALGVFAPDPLTSWSYSSAAAMLSAALAPYNKELSLSYRESAERAWQWAVANEERVLSEAQARAANTRVSNKANFDFPEVKRNIETMRLVAAVDLYLLTGKELYKNVVKSQLPQSSDGAEELGAAFRLAMWPPENTDSELIELARKKVLTNAEKSLEFGRKNAFGIHTNAEQLPMMGYTGFYSVPETTTGPVLPRAYLLSGDPRFLRGAIHAAHFSAGANPLNMTFTTGVGHDFPRNPLHVDSRKSGWPAPDGLTVYGPMDSAANYGFNEWVHRWHLGDMHPSSRTWPASEWYVDIYLWPAMTEYTVHQTFRPTAYAWGFLASRNQLESKPANTSQEN